MDDAYDHDHAHYHAARAYIYFLQLHLWELMCLPGTARRALGLGLTGMDAVALWSLRWS